MQRAAFVLAAVLISSCSSSDPGPAINERRPPNTGGYGRGAVRAAAGASGLELLPPSEWWRDPYLAEPLNLSNDQLAALDKIAATQLTDVANMERDSAVAVRDLRGVLAADNPANEEILAAASRMRALRDALFDKQAQLLAAERLVLTRAQWESLQNALQQERVDERRNRGGRMGGGRGGFGGRGRGRFPG